MREFDVQQISSAVAEMVQDVNYRYPADVKKCLDDACDRETSKIGKATLEYLKLNADIADEKHIPICQDTGMVVVYLYVGQEVHLVNGSVNEAIQEGVRQGYEKGYLRKSMVKEPLFERVNTKDNTPCMIYTSIIEGDKVIVEITCKGAGSENMSVIEMLKPAQGIEGVKQTVLNAVKKAGPNACPPMVVGVGIGGSFDYAAYLAKKATVRSCNSEHEDPRYAQLEKELLADINKLNIGPQGLKGDTTALKVNIETHATHIACLPCAVNISCHITRHARREF